MKVLHLTLKKKWFDLIASGEKKEEYREIKMYWAVRFCDGFPQTFGLDPNPSFKDYDAVHFVNGGNFDPKHPSLTIQCTGIAISEGRPEWGAEPGKKYFVIKLGEKIPNDESITKTI